MQVSTPAFPTMVYREQAILDNKEYDKLERARLLLDEKKHKLELDHKERQHKRELAKQERDDRRTQFWNNYQRSEAMGALLFLCILALVGTGCTAFIMFCVHCWFK